ncbi:hypothetical protein THAOC_00442 [Thalassiosira oceanica]|uniref:Uncharacterized protein n=1 Tax=Thalassiosira oceanica TaxID=159749 RepID=K0TJA6_THAOC|nr:hypothetical protein THAOC_00442 [Thalassiosira oceanica]|eukprot:EJK77710.1 hypothetical protein THAOC_00442 [Thalassiosira oceanica]
MNAAQVQALSQIQAQAIVNARPQTALIGPGVKPDDKPTQQQIQNQIQLQAQVRRGGETQPQSFVFVFFVCSARVLMPQTKSGPGPRAHTGAD